MEITGLALSTDLEFVRYVLETMKVYTYEYLEEKEVSRIKNELMRFDKLPRKLKLYTWAIIRKTKKVGEGLL